MVVSAMRRERIIVFSIILISIGYVRVLVFGVGDIVDVVGSCEGFIRVVEKGIVLWIRF